jgi:hypothetical protein
MNSSKYIISSIGQKVKSCTDKKPQVDLSFQLFILYVLGFQLDTLQLFLLPVLL